MPRPLGVRGREVGDWREREVGGREREREVERERGGDCFRACIKHCIACAVSAIFSRHQIKRPATLLTRKAEVNDTPAE